MLPSNSPAVIVARHRAAIRAMQLQDARPTSHPVAAAANVGSSELYPISAEEYSAVFDFRGSVRRLERFH